MAELVIAETDRPEEASAEIADKMTCRNRTNRGWHTARSCAPQRLRHFSCRSWAGVNEASAAAARSNHGRQASASLSNSIH